MLYSDRPQFVCLLIVRFDHISPDHKAFPFQPLATVGKALYFDLGSWVGKDIV